MSRRKTKRKNEQGNFVYDLVYGALLVVIVGIMPLVVRFIERPVPQYLQHIMPDPVIVDAFTYWKGVLVIIPAIAMLLYPVVGWIVGDRIPKISHYFKKVPLVLGGLYLVFVLLSAIFSSYRGTAWFGTSYREEGAFMWIMYFVVFASTLFYVRGAKHVRPILFGLTFSSIIMGAIGAGQLVGADFFNTPLATYLVTGQRGSLPLNTVFTIAHGTLFNPNTFGKYTAMVAPLLLIAGIYYKGHVAIKIPVILAGALMLVGIFASGSLGGLIGVIAALTAIATTLAGRFIYSIYKGNKNAAGSSGNPGEEDADSADTPGQQGGSAGKVAGLTFIGVVLVSAVALLVVPPLNDRLTTLLSRLQEAATAQVGDARRLSFTDTTMASYQGSVRQYTMEVLPSIEYADTGWLQVTDAHGQGIVPTQGPIAHMDNIPGYMYAIPQVGTLYVARFLNEMMVQPPGQRFAFLFRYENGRLYNMRPDTDWSMPLSDPVPAWGFEGRETWGSSRGYIWSRSFPLMPSRIILGSGPDTFINVFPHHDMAGLHLAFGTPYQVVG